MQSINFDDGYKTYAINGDENNVIRVNITDFNLVRRYEDMLPKLDKMVNQYKTTSKLTAEEIQKTDSEIRQAIDEVFNSDISSHVFGSTHPLTVLESGKLLVESFIEAFMPIVQKDIEQVKKSAGHRIDTSKAEKYLKDDAPFIPLDTPTEKVDLSKLSIEEKEKIFMEMFK